MKSRAYLHSRAWALAGPLAAFLLVAISLFLVIRANSDLAAGRFALFMDEGMVFDGVSKILHPASLRNFAFAIVNGGDQRYGRSLWNLTALVAYLPERIWGDTGLIIAERMSQAFLLYFAIITLTLTFIRRWPWRLLSLLLLLVVPYADYYFTSPKPEPLELALLAIFLWLHKRRSFSFGPHWLVLGLAFGTKISALPLVLLFALASAIQDGKWRGRALSPDEAVDTAAFFFAGLALTVPMLLKPVCFALALIYAGRWLFPRAWTSVKLLILAAALSGAMIVGRRSINLWLDGTFRNTSHGQDEASINAVSWLNYFFHTWLSAPVLLSVAFVGFAGLLVLWRAFRRAREGIWRDIEPGFLLVAGGAAMNVAIFVSAHRLWGFYLLPGMVLLLVGLVASMEASFATLPTGSRPDWGQRFVALVSLGLGLVVALFYWLPQNYAALNRVSQRSLDPSYHRDYAALQAATGFLSAYADTKGRPVVALWDPLLFLPRDTAQYKLKLFWGPYTQWQSGPEVLVLGKTHTAAAAPVPPDSPVYSAYLAERKGYSDYVIDKGQLCRMTQCYARAARLPGGGEILVRQAGPS